MGKEQPEREVKHSNAPILYTEEELAQRERLKRERERDPEAEETRDQWRQRVLDQGTRSPDHTSTPSSRKLAERASSPDSGAALKRWAGSRGPNGR